MEDGKAEGVRLRAGSGSSSLNPGNIHAQYTLPYKFLSHMSLSKYLLTTHKFTFEPSTNHFSCCYAFIDSLELRAKTAVVSNCDQWTTYGLVPVGACPALDEERKQWESNTAMCGSFMHLHLGIDAKDLPADMPPQWTGTSSGCGRDSSSSSSTSTSSGSGTYYTPPSGYATDLVIILTQTVKNVP